MSRTPVLLLLCLGLLAGVAALSWQRASAELAEEVSNIGTGLAEKLAQHEVHLTALTAVIRMEPDGASDSLQGLAAAIMQFYPRIREIVTVNQSGTLPIAVGQAGGPIRRDPQASAPVLAKPGNTGFVLAAPGTYDLYKLVMADRQVRLRIDASQLLDDVRLPPGSGYRLYLGQGLLLDQPAPAAPFSLRESVQIANASQPMRLVVTRNLGLAQLLPLRLVVPLLVLAAALVWIWSQYRAVQRERQRQERRALLLEQETRLAHAARVNALGEMASGIAHELAQPMTALLGQSQAARRAAAMGMTDVLTQALDANIREAKRAGDILSRMRAHIAGRRPPQEVLPLDRALDDALQLVLPELDRRGLRLQRRIVPGVMVRIDSIAFQQVIHNLLINAAEALLGRTPAIITLTAAPVGTGQVRVTISDTGPGLAEADITHLFEPFFTTKPDGLGLGLPLSARLIEAMEGQLSAANGDAGGAEFTILLPIADQGGNQ